MHDLDDAYHSSPLISQLLPALFRTARKTKDDRHPSAVAVTFGLLGPRLPTTETASTRTPGL